MKTKSLGQIAYEGYCSHTGWKSLISGVTLPPWNKLDDLIKEAWVAATLAVEEKIYYTFYKRSK